MATKTITLKLDAYEKLLAAKRCRESFSSVVRRATLPELPQTGKELLEQIRSRGALFTEQELDVMEESANHDPPPTNPWTE